MQQRENFRSVKLFPPAQEIKLHYKGQRYSTPAQDATYKDLFSVTEEKKDEGWTVTKYDSFY